MTTRTESRKSRKNDPPTNDSGDISNPSVEDKWRPREVKVLGRASEHFTFQVSIPAVVLTIAVAVYIRQVQNDYENKFARLMKNVGYMKKLETLSKQVPFLEDGLSKLGERLAQIDERVVDMQSEINKANDNLTNVEMRINSISEISSKLEVDLPKQQERFTEITNKIHKTNNDFSNFSKTIDSINDETNDMKKKLEMAFQNQTSLNGLLINTTAQAEYVNSSVSEVQTVITEINKHLPSLDNMNKSVTLILSIDHLLPRLQRRLDENKVRVHGLEMGLNNTESRFKDIKEKSESVSETVSHAMEKQTNIEKEVKLSNDHLASLKQDMSNTDGNIRSRLTKLTGDLETSEEIILESTNKLNDKISSTEGRIGSMVNKVDIYSGKLENFKSDVDSLSDDVKEMKPIVEYTGPKVQELDIQVRNLQSQNTGMDVYKMVAFILIGVLYCLILYTHVYGGTQLREIQSSEPHLTSSFMPQKPQSILDRIHSVPVLQNKVCVLSFYSETMNLHKKLVDSALATSRKGNRMEVIHHLVRKHEDILSIPNARYIFVFVDFNERNVILENPGQDLGDKKLVTVQAAMKIGADVFVTYVRDKGSNQLFPGNLYNQELSAFTSHHELKRLENNQRCFSVYETFNNTQKESIVRSIL